MSQSIESLYQAWEVIEPILSVQSEADYWRGVDQLNFLLEAIGDDTEHPLCSLVETLGIILEAYETQEVEISEEIRGVEALRHLMEEFDLMPSDLPEIGTEDVVSEILAGKRELTGRQIAVLSERFNVSSAVFL